MESFTRGYTGYKDHLVDEAFILAFRLSPGAHQMIGSWLSLRLQVSGYIQ